MNAINKFLNKGYYIWVGLALLITIILRLPSHFEPLWYDDEAITLTVGQQLNHGKILYRDIIDHKTPILYWMAALLPRIKMFKLGASIIVLGVIIAWAKLLRILMKDIKYGGIYAVGALLLFTFLFNFPSIEGNLLNGEIVMTLFSLWGWLAIWQYLKERNSQWFLFVAGVMFGLSVMVKIPSGVEMIVCILVLGYVAKLGGRYKQMAYQYLLVVFGFMAPILLTSIWFAWKGAFFEFVEIAGIFNLGYIEAWKENIAVTQTRTIPWGVIFRALIAISGSIYVWFEETSKENKFARWWFIWSLFGALLSARPYPHYLIQIVAPGILLVWMNWNLKTRQMIATIVLVSGLWVSQYVVGFWRYPTIAYYENFINWYQNKQDNAEYYNNFDPSTWSQYQVANYIQANIKTNGKFWLYSDKPGIYVLTNASVIGKNITAYHIKDFGRENETLETLKAENPALIIWGPVRIRTEEIETWIKQSYHEEISFGQFMVWRKN